MENSTWIPLDQQDQLEKIFNAKDPVLVFKHSTRCHISSFALSRFTKEWDVSPDNCKCYLLDLIRFREFSNEIAQRSGIVHQSPQVILWKEGKVLFTATHHEIDAEEIQTLLS
ncbi:MAG: bacillithiol system redox-active protein YtxJ [Bacteroidota bacterium]|jgi:bacillithiol system protein YtxJ